MSAPYCDKCLVGRVMWLHDQKSEAHFWKDHECACICQPEPICPICCSDHMEKHVLILGNRINPLSFAPLNSSFH